MELPSFATWYAANHGESWNSSRTTRATTPFRRAGLHYYPLAVEMRARCARSPNARTYARTPARCRVMRISERKAEILPARGHLPRVSRRHSACGNRETSFVKTGLTSYRSEGFNESFAKRPKRHLTELLFRPKFSCLLSLPRRGFLLFADRSETERFRI